MAARAARTARPSAALCGAGGEAEGACELVNDIGGTHARRAGTGNDQHVERRGQRGALAAEEFAHQAADAVARRRATNLAAGGDAESRWEMLSGSDDHDEMRDGLTPPLALQRQELVSLAQAELRRETLRPIRVQFGCLGGIETVNRLRPLARRRLMTSCPPGVLIRARNPCVRLRRLLLGW